MFVRHTNSIVNYFESLRYLIDSYDNNKIRLWRFQLEVQGKEKIYVRIVPTSYLVTSLKDMCCLKLARHVEHCRIERNKSRECVMEEVNNLEIPKLLKPTLREVVADWQMPDLVDADPDECDF